MSGFLLPVTISRLGSSVALMAYAGSLPFLLSTWKLSAVQAGAIQSTLNASYAISLLLSSWLADRLGAKRVFHWSNWISTAAFVACALLARSYGSALLLFGLLGLTLGGSYAPALMLVADEVPAERRGAAIGLILAGASCGYFSAIAVTAGMIPWIGYERTWLALCVPVAASAVAGTVATHGRPNRIHSREAYAPEAGNVAVAMLSRNSLLLTGGYVAHCWELLGMWAWAPAFLTLSLVVDGSWTPVAAGVAVAAVLHVSGAVSTLVGGGLSDRVGRRAVLVAMALAGAALSFAFGWSAALGPSLLLVIAAAYGFAAIGDSGVLSTAMTEAVAPRHLGTILALRSILGFGAGAISPLAVGWLLDLTNPGPGAPNNWGWAFALLGVGGLLAAFCALLLPRDRGAGEHPGNRVV